MSRILIHPSLSPSKPRGSDGNTLKFLSDISEQSKSGGGDGIQTFGYSGSQSEECGGDGPATSRREPIGIEEQRTIERQEAEVEEEGSTEDVNELPATTTEEIIGKAQEKEKEQSTANVKQNVKKKQKSVPEISLQN